MPITNTHTKNPFAPRLGCLKNEHGKSRGRTTYGRYDEGFEELLEDRLEKMQKTLGAFDEKQFAQVAGNGCYYMDIDDGGDVDKNKIYQNKKNQNKPKEKEYKSHQLHIPKKENSLYEKAYQQAVNIGGYYQADVDKLPHNSDGEIETYPDLFPMRPIQYERPELERRKDPFALYNPSYNPNTSFNIPIPDEYTSPQEDTCVRAAHLSKEWNDNTNRHNTKGVNISNIPNDPIDRVTRSRYELAYDKALEGKAAINAERGTDLSNGGQGLTGEIIEEENQNNFEKSCEKFEKLKQLPNCIFKSVNGLFYDLFHWNNIPETDFASKIDYIFTHDGRSYYLILILSIIISILFVILYKKQKYVKKGNNYYIPKYEV